MRLITPERFAKMAFDVRKRGSGRMPDDLVIARSFAAAMDDPDPSGRQLSYTITTDCVDRQQDTIAADGWDLSSYLKSPVVLWGHNQDLVIGKAISVDRVDNGLKATVEFQPADMPIVGGWAEYAYRSGVSGFVRATSVGFRPLEWDLTEDPDRDGDGWFPGIDFRRQELTEFSIVGVPCNPEALLDPSVAPITISSDADDLKNLTSRRNAASRAAERRRLHDIRSKRIASLA
ncbi:HK97 family phage prohead protease [Kozakia baliensis]|uniref:Prohead serine protease domain-containing protein n=1 Tax=Kozakia baliensis TaxID=153496 RepID=A0A1D8UTH8_9PROT|nr:HK97 family phage prohead protease [Kozakia baliensis]AOX16929.1 hypothetical protein A0U89_07025 [Kozakia baliensis]GBR25554.1 bacteriophage protease [Kozakia baliensis NRIC 0488]GEL64023.1 hypothetical protein KBA01_13090 [Kozakia baliensis]